MDSFACNLTIKHIKEELVMFVLHKVYSFLVLPLLFTRGVWDCCLEAVKGGLVESIEILWMLGTKPATRCFPTDCVLIGSTRPSLADISVDLLAYFNVFLCGIMVPMSPWCRSLVCISATTQCGWDNIEQWTLFWTFFQ
jgi:hypothetical protein